MDKKRIYEILNGTDVKDIYYGNEPVWIQEVQNDKVKVGFLNSFEYKDLYIDDLYEKPLYNDETKPNL